MYIRAVNLYSISIHLLAKLINLLKYYAKLPTFSDFILQGEKDHFRASILTFHKYQISWLSFTAKLNVYWRGFIHIIGAVHSSSSTTLCVPLLGTGPLSGEGLGHSLRNWEVQERIRSHGFSKRGGRPNH